MNYVLFSDYKNTWNSAIFNVFSNNLLKEVDINGQDRVDCIFGEIDCRLLESEYNNPTGRDRFSQIQSFFNFTGGSTFGIFELQNWQDLLYSTMELEKGFFNFFDEEMYTFEIFSFSLEEFGLNSVAFKYFIIIYNKNISPKLIFNDNNYYSYIKGNIDTNKDIDSFIPIEALEYILIKIQENLLK